MTRKVLRGAVRLAPLAAVAAVAAACGDAPTPDDRGYTKAPLENPGLFIEQEPVTEMSRIGEPIRPPIVDLGSPAQTEQ